MQDLTDIRVAVGRIEEQLKTVTLSLSQNAEDRRADSVRLTVLERQQERHVDSTVAALDKINAQLKDFILDSQRHNSGSEEAMRTITERLTPLEDDLRKRLERAAEAERATENSDRNAQRLRNGVGIVAAAVGALVAARAGLKALLAWLIKVSS